MTISAIDNSQRTAAKVAGLAGLFTMAIVVFANYGLLNPLMVPGNPAETARNIVAHEQSFRIAVTCFLIYSAGVVVLLTALYVILKPVSQGLALVGALFRLGICLVVASYHAQSAERAATRARRNLLTSLRGRSTASLVQAKSRREF